MHTMLATRSDFSIGESTLHIEDIIKSAVMLGEKSVALTDTMSVSGMVDFYKAAEKDGIKGIIGTRLRISENATWRPDKARSENKKNLPPVYFVTLYARTHNGLKCLYRLLSKANSKTHFYITSRLDWSDVIAELNSIDASDFALVLGDEQGIYQHKDIEKIISDCVQLSSGCNLPCVYLPFVAINTPYYGRINLISVDLAEKFNLPILAIRPALYSENNANDQEIMAAICEGTKATDGWYRSRYTRDLHPVNSRDFLKFLTDTSKHMVARGSLNAGGHAVAAIKNTDGFVDSFSYSWAKTPPSLPKIAANEMAAVRQECITGFTRRFCKPVFGYKPSAAEQREVYLPRLKYELSVLEKLGFASYFLTVQDITKFAKDNGISVGPGRGSVGGSLVAYLMGITDIDPIRFGLIFERFINPERIDLPDADLDFMSTRRGEIYEYLVKKFGADYVAGVSNFSTLGSASSIRDVSKFFGIPEKEYYISKFVPKEHGNSLPLDQCKDTVAEIGEFAVNNAAVWPYMERLSGNIRNLAQHAAGIVVAGKPLTDFAVVETRGENSVIALDKTVIEEQGLVKIDVLGLSTLDIIKLSCDYIKEQFGKAPDMLSIPLDDPAVLKAFADGKTTGVFQLESGGMKSTLRSIAELTGIVTFDDITACTSLYRPGPMDSGLLESYIKRKQGLEEIEYDHPSQTDYLSETLGVMVYQEQVMKTAQTVAGYTGPEADKLRKIMGKKKPDEMAQQRDKFVNGCIATVGASAHWANNLFSKIEKFAGYGFNKSHAAAYSLISYQAMYLKVHYPLAFYAATMSILSTEKLTGLMRDAKNNGVNIFMPDINRSSDRFEIDPKWNAIIIPFSRALGISSKGAEAIVKARQSGYFTSKADFLNRVEKRVCNSRVQDILDRVGAFASIEPSQPSANDPSRIKDQVMLLPGLISDYVPIARQMHRDEATKQAITELVDEYRLAHGPEGDGYGLPVRSWFGRDAKVMVVTDAPTSKEEEEGVFGSAKAMNAVTLAMQEADLTLKDIYWTGLIKCPKVSRQVTTDEITKFKKYFDKELEILKPTVIVLLGSQVVRSMFPNFKGKASESAGEVVYMPEIDANVVIGFNPGEIYFSPDKQDAMNSVFATVGDLVS